jgi:flagellar hook-associated protein 1 FlgK
VETLAASTNGGSATLTATRTGGAGALTTSNYLVRYEGGSWSVQRADSGQPVSFTTSGSTLQFEGLSVDISGSANAGDRFLVRPTSDAISGMRVLISDPARIAAASLVRTGTATGNVGTATISGGEVLDPANAALRDPVTISFTGSGNWEVRNAANVVIGSGAYVPGGNIEFNGWRVTIEGTPVAGDSFTVAGNTGGVGDNRNALALAGMLGSGLLSGGTESLNDAVTRFVGQVGVAAGGANARLEAQQIIYDDAVASIDALSGVNLDEEAANMLRYQQAYQAAAQMIRVTQELMDTLMNAVSR